MLIILLFLQLLIPVSKGSSRCQLPNATTYLRSESTRLMEFSTKILKDVTLNECATSCTSSTQSEECLSFEYDSSTLQCSLHSDDGQPFGASVLAKATQTISFFQQICLLEEAVCEAPYSFERYPQSILIGHAMKVLSVNGLSDCLSDCALSQPKFQFKCRSVIYYYETGECVMNRDTKFIYPHLFKSGILDQLVDYFENNCADVSCSAEESLHWIRTEEYSIDETKDVIVESSDAQQCNQLCQNNKIGEENFPCKAFAYSNSKQECHLTAESSYVGHKGDKKFNLAPLSSGEYFEKYCLKTNLQCIEASFELVANRMMLSSYRTIPALSQHHCLTECMKDGARCASATYFYLEDECQLSDTSQFSRPDQFVTANFTDYFDKICDPAAPKTLAKPPELIQQSVDEDENSLPKNVVKGATNYAISTSQTESNKIDNNIDNDEDIKDVEALKAVHGIDDQRETRVEIEGTVIDDSDEFSREIDSDENEDRNRVKAHLSTECRMSGITVSITFSAATSGTIYIKDHFSSCRQQFDNSSFAELHIPFPNEDESNPRCGGTQSQPGKWDFMLVVERNEMKAPSVITTKDKSFQVTCDYSKILGKEQLATLKPKVEGDLKSEKILMEIVRNGQSVTTVPLGAEIELRWTVIDPSENLGFFINECIAERVGGQPPHPEPLKIIYQGCPEEKVRNRLLRDPVTKKNDVYSTKMKVFRFDGSRRVRIRCSIDVCVETCPPVICDELEVRNVDSYGRKKRNSSLEKWLKKSNAKKMKRRMVAGTLTIIDEEKGMTKPRPEFTKSQEQLCVRRNQVEIIVIILVLIIILHIAMMMFCYRRCLDSTSSKSETSSMYSEGGSSNGTASRFNTTRRPSKQPSSGVVPSVGPPRFAENFRESQYDRLHHFR